MILRAILFLALAVDICLLPAAMSRAAERPNILWLSCEDISPHLGCYGDPDAVTPNLDRLAAEGVRYANAFVTAGVCAPCRSAIISGVYQTTLGTQHMRCKAKLPEEMRLFPACLRDAGYYCTNNSKTDYQLSRRPRTLGRIEWPGSLEKAAGSRAAVFLRVQLHRVP